MANPSIWQATSESISFPELDRDTLVDVIIIGGGITGITAAQLLSNDGRRVAVLEAHRVGEGTTGFSTGNLYSMVDQRLYRIDSKFGEDTLRGVQQSRSAAIDLIERLIGQYSISCDFVRAPWFLFTESDKRKSNIGKEGKAASEVGLRVTELTQLDLPFTTTYGIRVEDQAQFNPLQYVRQLAKHSESANCLIFENSPAIDISDESPCRVRTPKGTLTADKIIMATHTPKGVMFIQSLLGPYREHGMAIKLNSGNYPPPGIYWSMEEAEHHSLRSYTHNGETWLIAIGEHYKVGQKDDYNEGWRKLEDYFRKRFNIARIDYRWSGQHYRPADGLPYIGSHSDNTFIATGFATDGLVYGTAAAMILTDQIAGRENPYSKIYDPGRLNPMKSAASFIKENANVFAQYLKDFPGTADVSHFKEIPAGEGKTISVDGEKLAAYRDERGALHVLSAVCPHMECIVDWNNAEKTWDCPCHGSRFTIEGDVIEGPAINPLEKKNISEKS